jgi:hypothetical protein
VIAAIVLAAAIAVAFILLSGGSDSENQQTADAAATEQAHSAQVAMETYATEEEGSYAGATAEVLQRIEPTLPDDLEVEATSETYVLTVPSAGDNTFSVSRGELGEVGFACERAGVGLCPISGDWSE